MVMIYHGIRLRKKSPTKQIQVIRGVKINPSWQFFTLDILTQPMDPEKKSLNFIFPTTYVIPKSLKFSHWPSKHPKSSKYLVRRCEFGTSEDVNGGSSTDPQQVFGCLGLWPFWDGENVTLSKDGKVTSNDRGSKRSRIKLPGCYP